MIKSLDMVVSTIVLCLCNGMEKDLHWELGSKPWYYIYNLF